MAFLVTVYESKFISIKISLGMGAKKHSSCNQPRCVSADEWIGIKRSIHEQWNFIHP